MDIEEKTIKEKITLLTPEIKEKFERDFGDKCNDRYWCGEHGIDYVNLDGAKVREILFAEKYTSYISH